MHESGMYGPNRHFIDNQSVFGPTELGNFISVKKAKLGFLVSRQGGHGLWIMSGQTIQGECHMFYSWFLFE